MNNSQLKKHNFLVAGKPLIFVRAFTIIELIVVIAIISILSLVVVTNAGSARAKARDAKRASDIASIQLALAGFYNKCGQYPFGEDMDPDDGTAYYVLTLTSECYDAVGNSQGFAFGDFMTKIPTDPSTGAPYGYVTMTDTNGLVADYHLGAFMETQNQALRDRAGFDSTSNNIALNVKYFVFGGPYVLTDGYYGMDATANPLLYDVRPGI